MKINITLFLQVIHFYITYRILNRFIFGQTIKSLEQKSKEEHELVEKLESQRTALIKQEQVKRNSLLEFQKKVREKYTIPTKETPKCAYNIKYKRNASEIENLTKKIKNIIVKEIPRVR